MCIGFIVATIGSILIIFGPKFILHIQGAELDENFTIQYGKKDTSNGAVTRTEKKGNEGREPGFIKGSAEAGSIVREFISVKDSKHDVSSLTDTKFKSNYNYPNNLELVDIASART